MKAGLFFLAGLAAAQPSRHRRHLHPRANVVFDVVTEVTYVTSANVIVYVDTNGVPVTTVYKNQPQPTQFAPIGYLASEVSSASYSAVAQPPPSAYQAPSVSTTLVPSYSAPAPASSVSVSVASVAPAPAASSSAPAPAGYGGGGVSASGNGVTYSPYRTDHSCKSFEDVNADFQAIFSQANPSIVRLYGTDCNQVSNVLKATQQQGTKLFLGIFDINNVDQQAQQIVAAVNGDWSRIDTVSVGNELVNNGQASVDDVRRAVDQARGCLTGYSGPVVTVDTFIAIINNPGLCSVGDYVAANCHAFFDGGITADGAGSFVQAQAARVAAACGGKRTVITESGWPSEGESNRAAVPSLQNQQTAIASLKGAFSKDLFLFSAFNEYWKPNNHATFNAEQHWGIMGDSASCWRP